MFHIALLEPEIALNTGSIARTCLAAGATLHLIRPLGFRLTDDALRRSGMDYWDRVTMVTHASYATFRQAFEPQFTSGRIFSLTTKGHLCHSNASFQQDDVLLFGPESRGLPAAVRQETSALRIPMTAEARSLNLGVSVGIMVYEAWRQLDYRGALT